MQGWFVTGTGTGVGKTAVAGALARIAHEKGVRVGVFKPVATGCRRDPRLKLICGDAEFLAHCADAPEPLDVINPVRYAGELAPMVAAEHERVPINWEAIDESWQRISRASDVVIVEGAGGLLVPIDAKTNMADLAKRFDLPLIIVARPGLGTINHTLLTIEAAKARKLNIAAIVINDYRADASTLAEETNPEVIGRLAKTRIPVVVPHDPMLDVARGRFSEVLLQPLRPLMAELLASRK